MENRPSNINLRSGDSTRTIYPGVRRTEPPTPTAPSAERTAPPPRDNKFLIKMFERLIDISLFMIFLGFPLFYTGQTLQGQVFEKQIYFYLWLILALVAWVAKGVTLGEMNIRRTPLDLPIIGFWLVYLLSTVFSVDRWHSFWGAFADPSRGFMSITALVIAYYLILSNFNARRLKIMLSGFIVAGTIICLWTLLAILNIQFLPLSIAVFSPISLTGSMLGVAIVLCALIPLLTVAILKIGEDGTMGKIKRRIIIIGLLIILVLNLFLILALYNFIPWLALFIGIVLFVVFILSQVVRPASSLAWLPMVLFVAIMALRMIGVVPIAKINFAEIRPLDWGASLDVAKGALTHKAFLGSGPATYGYDFSLYRPQSFNANMFYNLRYLQGTGLLMEALATIGGIGTFLLIIILLSYLSFELYLLAKEKEKNKLLALGLFCAVVIFIAASVTTKVEGTVMIAMVLLGILALAVTMKESGSEEKNLNLSLKASPKFALALAFVFMVVSAGVAFLLVFLGKLYVADIYAGKSARVTVANKEDSVTDLTRAIGFYPQEGKYYTQLGQYYMVLANSEAIKTDQERDIQKIRQYLNSSVAATNLGTNMMKNDVSQMEISAQIFENAGLYVSDSYNLAIQDYQNGLALEPHNPNFYLRIGQIKMALATIQGDATQKKQLVTEARDMFQKAVNEKSDLAEAYYQLSLAQNALGDNDNAINNGKVAVALAQTNTDYIISLARMLQGRGNSDDDSLAEQLYKVVIAQSDSNVSAHFYLGMLYEKEKNKQAAKDEYNKVISLLPPNNDQTKQQLQKMVGNVDAGIENTPQNLGLTGQNSNNNSSGSGQ